MLKRWAVVLLVGLAVAGCSTAEPVLYPNAHLKSVGQVAANRDIDECKQLAETYGASASGEAAGQVAGSTAIGNLGQYFTFRLPGWDDDVATTAATVTALGLIAGQETEVLVHSNLDDGFAATLSDLASALGVPIIAIFGPTIWRN